MLAELPFPVGGLVMSFVPPPERAPVRRACRTMAAWPAEAVALVRLDPGEADRLRNAGRRAHAVAAMPVDGWWRGRALVVRVLGARAAGVKRNHRGELVSHTARDCFYGNYHRTGLPAPGPTGWEWLVALFPAVRAVQLDTACVDLQPPPGVVLVAPGSAPCRRRRRVCVAPSVLDDPPSPDELQAALRRMCRGAYPSGELQLCVACTEPPMAFADACAAAVAAGFAPLGGDPPAAADAEPLLVVVGGLGDARATHIHLNAYAPGSAPEVADGTAMATVLLCVSGTTPELLARLRLLAWPRLGALTLNPRPSSFIMLTQRGRTASQAVSPATLRWAAGLPRLHTLSLGAPLRAAGVAALCRALDHRVRAGRGPLRLTVECSPDSAVRLAAHPGAALVSVRLAGLHAKGGEAAASRVCEALTAPAGPAVLEALWLIARPPRHLLRALARAQPFLRDLA